MGAPFRTELLGWKPSTKNKLNWKWVPNSADTDNATSLRLAALVLERLGEPNPNETGVAPVVPPPNPGVLLETQVQANLATELPELDPSREWHVRRGCSIVEYAQYEHLLGIERAIRDDPNLRVTLGTDYLIKPDVLVGIHGTPTQVPLPWLHAALACKWTIRSDRVQNIRHENGNMIRHRRGRLPHLVTVTAEPLPSRLASIARGTGEVDATYHIAYDELAYAVAAEGNPNQVAEWEEVTGQHRLLDYRLLSRSLVDW
ncbi:restriction endonuclease [Nocardia cyriacigeorgica]|uniref:Restriction endonuclease n=1 Tax=Nocardia cyriacigeorgica TaxID=135487 RepID=A0A6P1CRN3_9NOCA|nr:NgoMIV family type II restriction endonuclease [Nocardia cyriacigeorgica]MBF6423976.1 restriction endonuclease [Nocardia cyriacigeorgica]NEW35230.1 restriction endonuclease [Nocardia cyriacigeorgica]